MSIIGVRALKDLSLQKKKWLSLGGLMVVSCGFLWTKSHPVSVEKIEEDNLSTTILVKLEQLENKIEGLNQKLAANPLTETKEMVREHFSKLSGVIKSMPNFDSGQLVQTFADTIQQTEASLKKDITDLSSSIKSLTFSSQAIQFLPKETLPFKVLSIDSIQGTSVGSMEYDFKTIPLEEGDSLAGWKIKTLDYAKQCIELTNSKNEHVRLKAQDIG